MILNAMLGVTRIFIMSSRAQASAMRVADVLELPRDLKVLGKDEFPAEESRDDVPHIEFRHVSFSYTGIGKNISDLSFRLPRGGTLGVLGSTGSGKSTIVNLLLRIYDADSGQILIDGQDIRTIGKDELRKKFGAVFQNDFITEGSIADNIRFFRDIGEADVRSAAEDAQAEEFISEKGGLGYAVDARGSNLSGGQKQRLLIARALAAGPEILILDDASSALDYRTDALLRRALARNHRSTTTVMISSVRHADLILVLDDGRVIGEGTHEELMASCSEYRLIADTQMGTGEEAVNE